jgi:Protein of unknown function (DUF2958)
MNWSDAAVELMPASLRASLPALYESEKQPHPVAQLKLFTPDSNWTWYVIEGSYIDEFGQQFEAGADTRTASDYMLYALVDGLEREAGYVSLTELATARGPLGLPIERDLHFRPCRVSEL